MIFPYHPLVSLTVVAYSSLICHSSSGVSKELDADVVELPYRGGAASLFVLLPRDRRTGDELDRMLQRLTPAALASAVGNLTPSKVQLKFPKLKLESSLRNELIEVGWFHNIVR